MIPNVDEMARWRAFCATADALSDAQVNEQGAELARECADLPAPVRIAARPWATRLVQRGSEPRLRLCRALSLEWSKLDQLWRALDAADAQTIEVLYLSGRLERAAAPELARRVGRLPVTQLVLRCPELGAGLAALFGILRLRSLGARDSGLQRELEAVAAEADSRVMELDLGTNFLRPADLDHLVRIRGLERLERLVLTHNTFRSDGAAVLATRLPCELRALDLEGCHISDGGFASLAGSTRFSNLESLNARGSHTDDDGVIAFAASTGFPALAELRLGDAAITPVGVRALLTSTNFPALKSLELRGNSIDDGIVEVLKSSGTGSLTSFELDDGYMTDEAREALVGLGLPALKLKRTR